MEGRRSGRNGPFGGPGKLPVRHLTRPRFQPTLRAAISLRTNGGSRKKGRPARIGHPKKLCPTQGRTDGEESPPEKLGGRHKGSLWPNGPQPSSAADIGSVSPFLAATVAHAERGPAAQGFPLTPFCLRPASPADGCPRSAPWKGEKDRHRPKPSEGTVAVWLLPSGSHGGYERKVIREIWGLSKPAGPRRAFLDAPGPGRAHESAGGTPPGLPAQRIGCFGGNPRRPSGLGVQGAEFGEEILRRFHERAF